MIKNLPEALISPSDTLLYVLPNVDVLLEHLQRQGREHHLIGIPRDSLSYQSVG